MSFLRTLLKQAAQRSEQSALVIAEKSYSYRELIEKAYQIADKLGELKATDNKMHVAILASRSFETYCAILAALFSGITYVILNPKLPKLRLLELLQLAKPAALIVDEKRLAMLEAELSGSCPPTIIAPHSKSCTIGECSIIGADQLNSSAPHFTPADLSTAHPANIVFTSGSTGVPKGVLVSGSNLQHFVDWLVQRYPLSSNDRVSQFYEISFDAAALEFFLCWCNGATLYVVPEGELLQPANFIRRSAITVWISVPSVIAIMQRLNVLSENCFPNLKLSLLGGEALTLPIYQAWRAAAPQSVIENIYGPTEVTICCMAEQIPQVPRVTEGRDVVCIGKPPGATHAAIADEQGNFLAARSAGELCFCGPQVALGYLDNAQETASKFVQLKHQLYGTGIWYRTGDLAYQDEQGWFYHLGRIGNQIKLMGQRIELEEVEAHLLRVSSAASAACVAWPMDDGLPQGIVAFVVGSKRSAEQIIQALKLVLPSYMLPARIIMKESLPLTLHGKVDRKALLAELNSEP